MNEFSNGKLTENAKKLRREMTKEEKHLWYDFLKKLPFEVKRQKVIGKYIVDFYIPKYKIVIELDGIQHYTDESIDKDSERDIYLQSKGLHVLRYPNSNINNKFEGVCADIVMKIKEICDIKIDNFDIYTSSVTKGDTFPSR